MDHTENKESLDGLTATEVSNIWSSYLKNSMEQRFFEYFYNTTEDNEIKKVIKKMLLKSQKNINELKDIFLNENLTIPLGFTDEDVRAEADKVFSDTFILYFCFDFTLLSMSTYPIAFSDSTRKDVRYHLQENIEFTLNIQNELVDLMLSKGVFLKPPQLAIERKIEFADSIKYLNGFFGGSRPVNVPEIANLSRVIHRAQFSKMVFVAFNKLATTKDLKKHFSKGRDGIEKVLDSLQEVLEKENIPISSSGDYKILDVGISPFSDKLMLFFINTCLGIFCFSMISQAMNSSLRTDIILKFNKIADDMKMYYGQGLLFAIKEKWLEEPPQAVDRKV